METSSIDPESRKNALRLAGNTWRRFLAYKKRFAKKYPSSSERDPVAFFNNRLLEDTYAVDVEANPLQHGFKMTQRQKFADRVLKHRSSLDDPTAFDEVYAESLSRRMPGFDVEVEEALSASTAVHKKPSIRTFVTKTPKAQ